MSIPFKIFFERLQEHTNISTQMGLANALGVNRSAVTQAKVRDAVPQKWILQIARKFTLSPDWLEFGEGSPWTAKAESSIVGKYIKTPFMAENLPHSLRKNTQTTSVEYLESEIIQIPKVPARLCAGGGSFEIDNSPISTHSFPFSWLAKMGNPSSMVFMDVVGNSMEPGILEGDMVLVDQSNINTNAHGVFAVGVEDTLFLKRVQRRAEGLALLSDNPQYTPVVLSGDELDSFRILGKVVWLCRDCRFY